MNLTDAMRPWRSRLPAEIHAALVETLFGTVGSFAAGVIGGLLVPIVAFARTHDPIFILCAAVIFKIALFRLVVLVRHNRTDPEERQRAAARWETIYAAGGIGYMLAVGVTSALLFYRHHDELTTLYGVIIALGCISGLAGRNAGRPIIVYGQVVSICAPLAITLLFQYDAWYWGLAFILALLILSVKSTTKFLNGILLSALLTGREASIQRARFLTALDSMVHGLCMGDQDGVISVINYRLRDCFQLGEDTAGLTVRGLAERIARAGAMSPEARDAFVRTWETHVARRDSSLFSETIGGRIYDFRCEPMDKGGFVVVAEDVTDARLASREIEHLAHFDSLTGLPNRIQFHNQMAMRLAEPIGGGQQLALLSVDLDEFKEVNDTRGHPVGDELLCLVAGRLRQSVRGTDFVARYGGDEFQVLIQAPEGAGCAERAAADIIKALSASYTIDGHSITIGATVGIAIAPKDATEAEELMRCADVALYQAKAEERGAFRTFDPAMDTAMRRKREIERDLRDAIAADALELHYQPVVDTRTGEIVACEALVRMNHPQKGMIPPGDFISVAEETGLIVQLGDWVLRRACRDAAGWPEHVRVAVNFSAKQFVLGKDVAGDIRRAVEEAGLEPGRLEVEITESTIIEAKDALTQLRQISDTGVRISLDDFGTGYSSLSYLRQFPVDKIKIDRAFAQDVKSKASQAVIGSVSVLAHLLEVELVIEGVETREQLDACKSWNVHLVQGYLYSRPVRLAEVLPLLGRPQPFAAPRLVQVA